MAKRKADRGPIKLRSTERSHIYLTEKNKRNDANHLELRKFDPVVRRVVLYRESR